MEELKDILFIATSAYAAVQAYTMLVEEEKRLYRKEKRRIRTLKRNRANRRVSSSSSDEEPIPMPKTSRNSIVSIGTVDEQKVEMKSVEHVHVSEEEFIQNKNLATDGKFVETVVSKFSDEEFKDNFRVSRNTMEELYERFKDSSEYKNICKLGDETTIPSNYYILMFLWFVGKKCTYMEVSKVFNVPLSRCVFIIDVVIHFLYNSSADYIRFPNSPSEKRIIAEDFQDIAEFPDVIGCLLNSYIQVQIPKKEAVEILSPSDIITATIQAICDSKGRFLDVHIDPTSKVHPVTMFNDSPMHEGLREICQGRYHVLADGDHYVREWFLTPFKRDTAIGQQIFNKKFNSTYGVALENFETLKSRFQQLGNIPSLSTKKIKKFIISCCVLKNICLELNDCFDMGDPLAMCSDENEEEVLPLWDVIPDDKHLRRIGELKRKQIVEQLLEE